jgi:aspartokinase-like uncharacterized kinase
VAELTARDSRLLIVKVGGSLVQTGRLRSALAMIRTACIPVVVVPGGGPFAESVRSLQRTMQFDDAVAHRLAMLGMYQMAELMVSIQDGLKVAQTLEQIADALEHGQVPVWAPHSLMAEDATVPAGWSTTSDSLAARLAELLGGARLALLKSVDVENGESAEELARRGVVDSIFPVVVARAGLSWSIFGPRDDVLFAAILKGQGGAGCRASSRRS